MSQFQRQESIKLSQQSLQREQALEGSLIAEKIDLMKNSIAEMSIISKGKMRFNLQKLEDQRKTYSQEAEKQQQRLRKQARKIEDELLLIEKEVIVRTAGLENLYTPLLSQIRKIQEQIKSQKTQIQEKYSEFRDRITTIKVRMTEIDIIIRQKARVFEHSSKMKLILLEGKLQDNKEAEKATPFTRQHENLKTLRRAVEQQSKKQQKQQLKIGKLIKEFKGYVDSTFKEQQKKQKQGFQQNYNTLQDLFSLLSSQYDTKY